MKAATRLVVVLTAAFTGLAAASVALAQVSEEDYLSALGDLAVRMEALGMQAGDVNAAWDAREVTLSDTTDAFASIESQADAVVQEVRLLTPPEDLTPQHTAMITAAEEALAASRAMIAGLNDANDPGDARRAATDQFVAAATEFVDIATLVTAPPVTTTTTLPPTTSTTPTTVAPATTSAPVTAALPTSTVPLATESDSGGDVETPLLILIGLLAGLLVGLVGGLLIGRRARHNLVDALRRERADGAPPA